MKNVREWATPVRKTTGFLNKGVLTPEEFVKAGDELVFKCPTWSWEGGDPSRTRKHLPSDKQYLVTRNVPCYMRVDAMEKSIMGETEMEIPDDMDDGKDKQEGWLVSHVESNPCPELLALRQKMDAQMEEEFDFVSMNENGEGEIMDSAPPKADESEQKMEEQNVEEDEYADMADFEDDNIVEDEATAAPTAATATDGGASGENSTNDNIKRVRTYDISITYDKYYQTPRVWIFGYSEDGSTPLTPDEMFQDVMTDYVRRTVTIETHPHVSGPHLSIHPCQHGAVMKNIVRNLTKDNESPSVESYIFIFLKFVSSIIPTMNYDFTMEVVASTEKA